VERHPEPKPELGLPQKVLGADLPAPGLPHLFYTELLVPEAPGESGYGILTWDEACAEKLAISPEELWNFVFLRAQNDALKHGKPLPVEPGSGKGQLGQTVWFPFRLGQGRFFFGLGIN
jgi:hypothetical protein